MDNLKINSDMFCKIFIDSNNSWINGLLTFINVDKKVAEIFLPIRYLNSFFKDTNKIIIKSYTKNNEYIFTGSISKKVVSINKQSLSVKIDEVIKYDNLRKEERYPASYPVILTAPLGNNSYSALLVDISSGGLMIATPQEFSINSRISVEIFFSTDSSLYFKGRILRKTNNSIGFNYGVIIEEIDKHNSILLNKMIEFLALERKNIYSYWMIVQKFKNSLYIIFLLLFVIITLIFILYL